MGFHFVSCITSLGVNELREDLIRSTLEQAYMGEKIPKVTLDFEAKLIEKRSTDNILKWDDVMTIALEHGVYNEKTYVIITIHFSFS